MTVADRLEVNMMMKMSPICVTVADRLKADTCRLKAERLRST